MAKIKTPGKGQGKRIMLTALVGIFWPAMWASYMLVIFLTERGFTNAQIGIVLSVNSVISVLMAPLWGMIADKVRSTKKTFLLCAAMTTLLFSSLYFVESPLLTAILIPLDVLFRCSMVSLIDHWLITSSAQPPRIHYGTIRVAGSVSYAAASFLFGRLIGAFSMRAVLPYNFALGLLLVLLAFFSPVAPHGGASGGVYSREPLWTYTKHVLTVAPFRTLLVFTFLRAMSTSSVLNFMPAFFEAVGGSPEDAAYAQAAISLSEIPCFLLAHRLFSGKSPKRALLAAGMLYALSQVGLLVAGSRLFVGVCVVPFGFAYALTLTAKLQYTTAVIPETYSVTAVTLLGAVEAGLGSMLSNLLAGFVLDNYSAKALNMITLSLLVAGLLFFALRSARTDDTGAADQRA